LVWSIRATNVQGLSEAGRDRRLPEAVGGHGSGFTP
jgi:hypothetical protein